MRPLTRICRRRRRCSGRAVGDRAAGWAAALGRAADHRRRRPAPGRAARLGSGARRTRPATWPASCGSWWCVLAADGVAQAVVPIRRRPTRPIRPSRRCPGEVWLHIDRDMLRFLEEMARHRPARPGLAPVLAEITRKLDTAPTGPPNGDPDRPATRGGVTPLDPHPRRPMYLPRLPGTGPSRRYRPHHRTHQRRRHRRHRPGRRLPPRPPPAPRGRLDRRPQPARPGHLDQPARPHLPTPPPTRPARPARTAARRHRRPRPRTTTEDPPPWADPDTCLEAEPQPPPAPILSGRPATDDDEIPPF